MYDLNTPFEDEPQGFAITDDGLAEWAISKIKEAQATRIRMSEHFKTQMDAINERTQQTVDYMTNLLNDYFSSVPHHTTKTGIEKYKLPSGELVLKPLSLDFVRDNDVLLAWCKDKHPQLVRSKEEPAWADIKAFIKETGEVPDGVTPVEVAAKFEVKTV